MVSKAFQGLHTIHARMISVLLQGPPPPVCNTCWVLIFWYSTGEGTESKSRKGRNWWDFQQKALRTAVVWKRERESNTSILGEGRKVWGGESLQKLRCDIERVEKEGRKKVYSVLWWNLPLAFGRDFICSLTYSLPSGSFGFSIRCHALASFKVTANQGLYCRFHW